jgi:hypothetical protein
VTEAVANPHRGEVTVKLDADYVLRPDFEAVAAIDEQLGSIIDVTRRALAENSLSFREVSVIILEGMKAHGRAANDPTARAFTLKRVQHLVFEAGILSVIGPVIQFLSNALIGGAKPEGNAPAAETAKT